MSAELIDAVFTLNKIEFMGMRWEIQGNFESVSGVNLALADPTVAEKKFSATQAILISVGAKWSFAFITKTMLNLGENLMPDKSSSEAVRRWASS